MYNFLLARRPSFLAVTLPGKPGKLVPSRDPLLFLRLVSPEELFALEYKTRCSLLLAHAPPLIISQP
jgi:hypothetical protein